MNDRNIFNQIVYTPLSEALKLLDERRKDPVLMAKVDKLLKGDIPEILKKKKGAILFRQIATPNHETKRFIALAKENDLLPVFFEYFDDKFTSNNEFKHSLGHLRLKDNSHKNASLAEKITVVDFSKHDGKKIREVQTTWNELLTDFHRKLFTHHGYDLKDLSFFEASEWYKSNGQNPVNYYVSLFLLFTCYGILFENFLTSENSEGSFTKDVILPSLEKVINLVGFKPLIVPLEPLDLETDNFWYHHDYKIKKLIPKK